MEPLFTNDAIIFGLLLCVLGLVFYTSSLKVPFWKKFYTYIPSLLLCYFLPALLHWPLGWIAPEWYDNGLIDYLANLGYVLPESSSLIDVQKFFSANNIDPASVNQFLHKSHLYFVASRYLLPASLILFCLSIDLKGIINLGPKALIMFFTATLGIVIGGPIAILIISAIAPGLINITPDQLWTGLSTVAGSWIGGGANQTAMKEIFEVGDNLFATMIIVDVVVANIWMGFLLYGASISDKLDIRLKADNSAITDLKNRISNYSASVAKMPTTSLLFVLLAIAFGGTAFSHFVADFMQPWMENFREWLERYNLQSLMSHFFWLIVTATTLGIALSFTRARKMEGVGASRWGSIFIYILVATIGMKMNLGEVYKNLGLFAIGLVWMSIHVILLIVVAKIIRAPFFFIAVGSQANVGGAASAPIVASAFSPSLAPVGVLMAVIGYALGTYGAIICAYLMQAASG